MTLTAKLADASSIAATSEYFLMQDFCGVLFFFDRTCIVILVGSKHISRKQISDRCHCGVPFYGDTLPVYNIVIRFILMYEPYHCKVHLKSVYYVVFARKGKSIHIRTHSQTFSLIPSVSETTFGRCSRACCASGSARRATWRGCWALWRPRPARRAPRRCPSPPPRTRSSQVQRHPATVFF